MSYLKKVPLPKADAILWEPDVIENILHNGIYWDKEDVLEIKKVNTQLTNGQRYVLLVQAGHLATISKEARELSASKDLAKDAIAKAIVTSSIGQRLVGNVYLTVNKPHIKTKLFACREKALEWLYSQRIKVI